MKTGNILRPVFKYGLPLALSVGLCYYLYTKIDMEVIRTELHNCNYVWIGLALVVAVFSHIFRAMRWRIQLDALSIHAPLKPLVWSIFGTYAVNLLLPRLGELWRTGYIARRQKAPFTTVFGSMVADRLADTLTVLVLLLFTFFVARSAFIDFARQYPQVYQGITATLNSPFVWACAVVGLAAIVALFVVSTSNRFVLKVRTWVKDLWHGFAVVATMPGKGRWLLLTVAVWGCYFLQLYMAFYSFSFTENLGLTAALVAFVLSSISMGIPSNGGLGPWHLAIIFALGLYGVGMNQAAAFSMIVWGSQNLMIVLLGLYSFLSIALENRKQQNS
ncbi:lysylphosphatidylglycerol synthase transmembrane domain-containing protein [uncultured Muribaculum sp.]|uniref:lysylphosphatidylglycerol synthase transmembrane domain-containing protein n=1 Tax=uncultured Muribaculum sp. TaxID=1918613 RepID=UPI00266ED4B1|nr:lysylphosphatidylglycerol synthase transmembrane domain-containing protein [uncultured Muribaculum sp.]